jgi:hypothetical protein
LLVAYSPLPAVLQPLVVAYATPTHEDMWTEGWSPSAETGVLKGGMRKLRDFFKKREDK